MNSSNSNSNINNMGNNNMRGGKNYLKMEQHRQQLISEQEKM